MDGRVVREMAFEPRVVLVRYPCGTTNFSWSIQLAGWSPDLIDVWRNRHVFTAALCSLYNCVHCSTVFIADCVHCSTLHVQTPASRVRSLPDNYRWLSKPLGSWREIASAWLLFQLLQLQFLPQYFPAQKSSRDELMSPFLCAFACLGACMASVCAWDYLCVGGRERKSYFVCIPLFV